MAAEVVPLRTSSGLYFEVLDQTLLPGEERYVRLATLDAVCEAIRSLRVRGAPLLGIAGAYGMAVAGATAGPADGSLRAAAAALVATRPTAADLAWAVHGALLAGMTPRDSAARAGALWAFADVLAERRQVEDRAMGAFGAPLIPQGGAVLTHCNTGALASGGIGTALGVIRIAWEQGRLTRCYATETRPLLQGARLTMWELQRLGIPSVLIPDTAAATLIASGLVAAVITGADRIAANGDTANKVGTYGLALAAARHAVPFYIAAPTSTFDTACATGTDIAIEFRDPSEVGGFGRARWSPAGIEAWNPAFDVTPADLVAAIVTERGVLRPPYAAAIRALESAL